MIDSTKFAIGTGTVSDPYRSQDGTAGLEAALQAAGECGGRVTVPTGRHDMSSTAHIDNGSVWLDGEVWNYSSDPNGVFEAKNGTKLRLIGRSHPALSVGITKDIGGVVISNLGIQGDIFGMDTRELFDALAPQKSAGLYLGGTRIDQCEFSKMSFCGLSAAICASGNAEIDAAHFYNINTDGCCMGVYFSPRASFYTVFSRCIIADNPSYGFYANGEGKKIHNLEVADCCLVRNCGSNVMDDEAAALYFKSISHCTVRGCNIDAAGVFWYYSPDATHNDQRQPSKVSAVGILIKGDKNRIMSNIIDHSSAESIRIEGNNNILIGNISDGNVIIDGENNTVCSHVFTKPEARLILRGAAAHTTTVTGVPEDRVIRE